MITTPIYIEDSVLESINSYSQNSHARESLDRETESHLYFLSLAIKLGFIDSADVQRLIGTKVLNYIERKDLFLSFVGEAEKKMLAKVTEKIGQFDFKHQDKENVVNLYFHADVNDCYQSEDEIYTFVVSSDQPLILDISLSSYDAMTGRVISALIYHLSGMTFFDAYVAFDMDYWWLKEEYEELIESGIARSFEDFKAAFTEENQRKFECINYVEQDEDGYLYLKDLVDKHDECKQMIDKGEGWKLYADGSLGLEDIKSVASGGLNEGNNDIKDWVNSCISFLEYENEHLAVNDISYVDGGGEFVGVDRSQIIAFDSRFIKEANDLVDQTFNCGESMCSRIAIREGCEDQLINYMSRMLARQYLINDLVSINYGEV